jgi:hypothetical protein
MTLAGVAGLRVAYMRVGVALPQNFFVSMVPSCLAFQVVYVRLRVTLAQDFLVSMVPSCLQVGRAMVVAAGTFQCPSMMFTVVLVFDAALLPAHNPAARQRGVLHISAADGSMLQCSVAKRDAHLFGDDRF